MNSLNLSSFSSLIFYLTVCLSLSTSLSPSPALSLPLPPSLPLSPPPSPSLSFQLLKAFGVSQGGGPGSCNIHLKGCVMDADTRRVFQLGTWLLRHKRQKAKGWLKSDREAKVCITVYL